MRLRIKCVYNKKRPWQRSLLSLILLCSLAFLYARVEGLVPSRALRTHEKDIRWMSFFHVLFEYRRYSNVRGLSILADASVGSVGKTSTGPFSFSTSPSRALLDKLRNTEKSVFLSFLFCIDKGTTGVQSHFSYNSYIFLSNISFQLAVLIFSDLNSRRSWYNEFYIVV